MLKKQSKGTNLAGINLEKVKLTQANLYNVNLVNASFNGVIPDGDIYEPESSDGESDQPEVPLEHKTSMNRKIIRTEQAPAPVGPYNQAVVASGQMVFVAGQIALDPNSGEIVSTEDVARQTEQVMANLNAILTTAGASFNDVVKTTVFLADMNDFAAMNAVYARYFEESTAPARACVEVSRLPKDVLVEIDCIAVI